MSTTPHFACPSCKKQYAWKSTLAGKKARCSCGTTIDVPRTLAQPEEDLYDLANPAPVKQSVRPPTRVQPSPVESAPGRVIAYKTPTPDPEEVVSDAFYDKPRDFYWPIGVLIAGVLGLLIWAFTHAGVSTGVVLVFSTYLCVATVLKTAIMIGAAMIIAPLAGVSFGTVWTAVLKLAAIVVVTDAALFWFEDIMVATGAFPGPGAGRRSWMWIGLVNTMLAAVIIAFLLTRFFDMDREDVGNVAVPLAILNRVMNFIILFVIAAILEAMLAPPAPAPTPAPAAAPATPAPVVPALPPAVAQRDAELAAYIKQDRSPVIEVPEFYLRRPRLRQHRDFMHGLYGLGARKVYIDIGRKCIYVDMPGDKNQRAVIIQTLRDFLTSNNVPFGPEAFNDDGGRYMTLPLPPEIQ